MMEEDIKLAKSFGRFWISSDQLANAASVNIADKGNLHLVENFIVTNDKFQQVTSEQLASKARSYSKG